MKIDGTLSQKKGIYSEMCQCCWRRFWRCTTTFAHFEICHRDGCAIVRHRQWTCRPTIFVDVRTTIYSDTPESGAELESAAPESGAQPLFLLMHQQPIFCEQLQLGTRKLHDPKMQNTTFNKAQEVVTLWCILIRKRIWQNYSLWYSRNLFLKNQKWITDLSYMI